jgi:hypothetical protein
MTISNTILALVAGTAFLIGPANAGGPVIIEEATETTPDRREIGALPIILGVAAVLAIIASQEGGCVDQPVEPEPPVTPDRRGC